MRREEIKRRLETDLRVIVGNYKGKIASVLRPYTVNAFVFRGRKLPPDAQELLSCIEEIVENLKKVGISL